MMIHNNNSNNEESNTTTTTTATKTTESSSYAKRSIKKKTKQEPKRSMIAFQICLLLLVSSILLCSQIIVINNETTKLLYENPEALKTSILKNLNDFVTTTSATASLSLSSLNNNNAMMTNSSLTSSSSLTTSRISSSSAQQFVKQSLQEPQSSHDINDNNNDNNHNNDDNVQFNKLPLWIQNYVNWHNDMRKKFPGDEIFTNPDAPKLIIRVCLGLCGGLNDRLGQLPWDLYLANQTSRLLLISWSRPKDIEYFLQPNILNWSIPVDGWGFTTRENMRKIRNNTWLFDKPISNDVGGEERPDDKFWNNDLDIALKRGKSIDFGGNGIYSNKKILIHRILGHLNEDILEKRLTNLGEVDMIHTTKSFGRIFHMFFKPSKPIQNELDNIYTNLNIKPKEYSAVHCRVRHPKARKAGQIIHGKSGSDYTADKTGLPFIGENKDVAVSTATRAINCAKTLFIDEKGDYSNKANEPVYFFSDSNDLVKYMVHDLQDTKFVTGNSTLINNNTIDKKALQAVSSSSLEISSSPSNNNNNNIALKLISRNNGIIEENPHIDKQKGKEPYAYYPTFIDLYIAINAKCMTYGVGFYAVFATKISGIDCKLLYQEEAWGDVEKKRQHSKSCTLPHDDDDDNNNSNAEEMKRRT